MIPDEAVEAAAKALAAQGWGGWEHVPNALRRAFLRDARLSLEAAAPHMFREAQAEAWSEGSHFGGLYPVVFQNDNPYRSQDRG